MNTLEWGPWGMPPRKDIATERQAHLEEQLLPINQNDFTVLEDWQVETNEEFRFRLYKKVVEVNGILNLKGEKTKVIAIFMSRDSLRDVTILSSQAEEEIRKRGASFIRSTISKYKALFPGEKIEFVLLPVQDWMKDDMH